MQVLEEARAQEMRIKERERQNELAKQERLKLLSQKTDFELEEEAAK